jgi:hypothetical protein
MKNLILFLIICSSIFQMNCISNKSESISYNSFNENTNRKGISSESAVLIAKERLNGEYKFESYDVIIKENNGTWIVTFSRKATGCCGGSPYVTIDKSDGRIIDVTHGK